MPLLKSFLKNTSAKIKKIKVPPFVLGKRALFLISAFVVTAAALSAVALFLKGGKKETPEVFFKHQGVISKGDTIYGLLKNYQVDDRELFAVNNEFKKHGKSPARLTPGDRYEIVSSTSGVLMKFSLKPRSDPFNFFEISRSTGGAYSSAVVEVKTKRFVHGVQGRINSSLYEAMTGQGLPAETVMRFADIFQWEIDFFTEPRAGDTYKVIWERVVTEDGYMRDQRILLANYIGKETGSKFAVLFKPEGGSEAYYALNGDSQKKAFLRAPLNYRRISSHFTHRRFHPILRYYRPHLGIDYAASHGTPVVSIGDGAVEFAGWKGQSGKCVIIKHNSVYTTSYGHFSGFAKGIKKGVRVKQGQLIGYVGSTGLATGPHLDFRIKKNGTPVNFLHLKIPPAEGIKKSEMEKFDIEKKRLLLYLSELDQSKSEKDIVTLEDVGL